MTLYKKTLYYRYSNQTDLQEIIKTEYEKGWMLTERVETNRPHLSEHIYDAELTFEKH